MGIYNNNNKNNASEIMNEDANILGDLNIYVCGNINTFLNCEDGFNYLASRNYYILEKIFEKINKKKSGNIQLKNGCEMYYQYELRQKIIDKKIYNAFLFFNKADEEFLDMLNEHLFEIDHKNGNKNVIIFFGEENEIIKSINKLEEKSAETVPFLIIINDSEYDDKLKYINYIPDLNTLKINLKEKNETLSEEELSLLSEKALVNYINNKLLRIDSYYNQLGYDIKNIYSDKILSTVALLGYSGCGKSTFLNLLFNELVSKVSSSTLDVTTKCSEYYFPIKTKNLEEIGHIRFLDFPGITESKNYINVVKPEIIKKSKEYKKNMEQIDISLFFINNGNTREFTDFGLELIDLLIDYNTEIIFVLNGPMNESFLKIKKQKIRNQILNKDVLNKDLSNIIHTNFFQNLKETEKTGVSDLLKKIIEIIKIKNKKMNLEDLYI